MLVVGIIYVVRSSKFEAKGLICTSNNYTEVDPGLLLDKDYSSYSSSPPICPKGYSSISLNEFSWK